MNVSTDSHRIDSFTSATLMGGECDRIISFIAPLYLWFSPKSTSEDMRKRLHQHPNSKVDILVNEEDGSCGGFSVHYTEYFRGNTVMFRGGTIVRDRSRGLYKYLLLHSIARSQCDYMVAMTQNPRVYETLRSFSPTLTAYPNSDKSIPDNIREIASHFCKAPVDPDSLIVRGVYGDIRKDAEFRKARSADIEALFAKSLGPDDGFFVVVRLKD